MRYFTKFGTIGNQLRHVVEVRFILSAT